MGKIAWLNNSGELVVSYNRPDFTSQTKALFRNKQSDQEICHFMSWFMIQELTTSIVKQKVSVAEKKKSLLALLNVLSTGEVPDNVDKTECSNVAFSCQVECRVAINQSFDTYGIVNTHSIENYLIQLNSHPHNLRFGNLSWNHSISSRADPRGWAHVNEDGNVDACQGKQDFVVKKIKNSFTLTSSADERQLQAMDTAFPDYQVIFLTATDLSDDVSFIYSSTNKFSLPRSTAECFDPINRN
ncbi:hypothetical protein QMA56_05865 [Leuconostoc falkenbergense]|uniref:hypothetical protein n=1 Tax=Leuconostoc falkenbergense TaxID=2766470 RepID=UPI0024ACC0E6|nr:hypothetical protein [Leuconostoc falkenbergense]MDI6667236.1 hypothetical protein [Leuconostoc falkenbergense]